MYPITVAWVLYCLSIFVCIVAMLTLGMSNPVILIILFVVALPFILFTLATGLALEYFIPLAGSSWIEKGFPIPIPLPSISTLIVTVVFVAFVIASIETIIFKIAGKK